MATADVRIALETGNLVPASRSDGSHSTVVVYYSVLVLIVF